MAKDAGVAGQLENYDFTRKVFAARSLTVLTNLLEAEAASTTPDPAVAAALGSAIAALLASVS